MSVRRLWTSLPEPKRREVAHAIAQAYQPEGLPPDVVRLVAGAIGFRVSAIRRGDVGQTASCLYRALPALPPEAATTLLVRYHTAAQVELLSDVYDALGVEHDGVEVEDAVLEKAVDPDAAVRGVAALVGKHATEDLHFCFGVMELVCSPAWHPAVVAVRTSLEGEPPPGRTGQ
ncbi:MAG TPA: hypothetical protein PLS53_11115 [Thermoanaerobaculaceae bacterium]|nr:hypothetical protein [Thermoanaerobaculaceae bacterium]HPS78695.1 hypothetical protein [Thermoanaerobaculaceae bacterium]